MMKQVMFPVVLALCVAYISATEVNVCKLPNK